MKLYILDDEKNPVLEPDSLKFAIWFETADRTVKATHIPVQDGLPILISTVFLGLDHNFFGNGHPTLYETMVFGGSLDGYRDRWTSRDNAEAGHNVVVKNVIAANVREKAP